MIRFHNCKWKFSGKISTRSTELIYVRQLSRFHGDMSRLYDPWILTELFVVFSENYHDLHKWSVQNRAKFWGEVWGFSKVIHSEPYSSIVDESIPINQIPKWFVGAKLNYAENLLERAGNCTDVAVYYKGNFVDVMI